MGFLKGGKFFFGEDRDARFAICWGRLTGPPEVKTFGDKIKTAFNIKVFTKTYENCVVWGDNAIALIAQALEKDDFVVCIGTEVTNTYKNKNGVEKTYYALNCECIIPPDQIIYFVIVLAQSARINAILNAERDELESDEFESAGDFDENGAPFIEVPDDLETPFM